MAYLKTPANKCHSCNSFALNRYIWCIGLGKQNSKHCHSACRPVIPQLLSTSVCDTQRLMMLYTCRSTMPDGKDKPCRTTPHFNLERKVDGLATKSPRPF